MDNIFELFLKIIIIKNSFEFLTVVLFLNISTLFLSFEENWLTVSKLLFFFQKDKNLF